MSSNSGAPGNISIGNINQVYGSVNTGNIVGINSDDGVAYDVNQANMDELSHSEVGKVIFLRNEAYLERDSISHQQDWLQGSKIRRDGFQAIRADAPDPGLIDIKIVEVSTDIDRSQAIISYSARMLQSHTQQLGKLINGKVSPKDLIEATKIELDDHSRFLQSRDYKFLGQKSLRGIDDEYR